MAAEGTYLCVGRGQAREVSPGTVFFKAENATLAEALCRLFNREYAEEATFHFVQSESLSSEDQVLLDEALDWLDVYDDPDPGVYDPPPTNDTLARAQYAVRARTWKAILKSRGSRKQKPAGYARTGAGSAAAAPPNGVSEGQSSAATPREEPRQGSIGNDAVVPSALSALRRLHQCMVRIDNGVLSLGGRLRTLREADPHGLISNPGRNGANFEQIREVQDSIQKWTGPILEAARDAHDACYGIAAYIGEFIDEPVRWETDLRESLRLLRDELSSFPHTHAAEAGETRIVSLAAGLYTQGTRLEDGLTTLEARVANPLNGDASTGVSGDTVRPSVPSASPAPRPTEAEVADAVMAAATLRDLICARRQYPNSIDVAEARALHGSLCARISAALGSPAFQPFTAIYEEPAFDDLQADTTVGLLMASFLMAHPQLTVTGNDRKHIAAQMETCMRACQDAADGELQRLANRVMQMLVVDCRIPSEAGSTEHGDARRQVQMLRLYWSRCREMVIHISEAEIGFQPYPLTHLVENLRARTDTLFAACDAVIGWEEARVVSTQLLDMVVSGEPDDLSAAPQWTLQQVAIVDQFLARAEIQLGSSTFTLTRAEEMALKVADQQIADYKRHVNVEWRKMLTRIDASKTAPPKTTSGDSGPKLVLDVERFTVTYGSCSCAFTKRQDQLFDLLARLVHARGGAITFDALREKNNVWDGVVVEDSTIRSAITRLRKHLAAKGLECIADAISTGTFRRKAFVQFESDKLQPNSN